MLLFTALPSRAQTLNLPTRATNAMTGTQFANFASLMTETDRENWIYGQVASGNIPSWLRTLSLVTTNAVINSVNHTVSYYTTPDYLAIGSDTDYLLQPMSPLLAQRLSKLLNCTLPTRKMVSDTWTKAAVKLAPNTMSPFNLELSFYTNNLAIAAQRQTYLPSYPYGALVSGDKKDVIISTLIYNNLQSGVPNPVVIFGWYQQNGVYIQGEVNVHDQTYMDYSHGDRMVQQAITVDGTNNTVTNVLVNPALAALLSDETTFTGNTIPQPYYTVAAVAPVILNHPASRTVKQGANTAFSVLAAGDSPLSYFWKFNGTTIAGATNQTLTVTNAQSASIGSYTVVVSNATGTATSAFAALQITTTNYPVLFSDDFDTDTSANWNIYNGSGNNAADYTVDFAFDYSATRYTYNGVARLIPPAPNTPGYSTRGVKLTVNSDATAYIAGVNLYLKNHSFSNNFALKFDMWINYPGNAAGAGATGSTQYPIFGLNHTGTEPNWAATNNTAATDGIWFGVDGEGGTSGADYRSYVGNPSGFQTQLTTTSGILQADNGGLATVFPTPPFETAGAPGKNWVAVELNQINGNITWKINDTIIATRANSTAYTNGTIMLGLMDVFSSIAAPVADCFVLFDNVRVEDLTAAPIIAPAINTQPQNHSVNPGTNVSFNVAVTGTAPLNYQWYFNAAAMAGKTNSTLTLTNAQLSNVGTYTVSVNNTAGSALSAPALLTVSSNSTLVAPQVTGRQVSFSLLGGTNFSYVIDVSSNLFDWTAVLTSRPSFLFTDQVSTNAIARYYRARLAP